METKTLKITIRSDTTVDQYLRAPILLEKEGRPRLFSDFRAVGAKMTIQIYNKVCESPGK